MYAIHTNDSQLRELRILFCHRLQFVVINCNKPPFPPNLGTSNSEDGAYFNLASFTCMTLVMVMSFICLVYGRDHE